MREKQPPTIRSSRWAFALAASIAVAPAALAQPGSGPAAVRYTEAQEMPVRKRIELPGTVQARTASLVAAEVAGVVARLAAREGETVRKGQPLVALKRDALEIALAAARGELREAEARLALAERNRARSQELYDADVLSRQQLDDAVSELEAWRGRVDKLRSDIARIELDLDRSTIVAPFAGVVVAERVDLGEWVGAGDPVMELVSLYDLEVAVDVPEQYFRNMNPGAAATIRFDALEGFATEGRIVAIIPRANTQSRTFPIRIRIRNEDGRIGVGMLAEVSFPAGEAYRATVVPKDAVITRGARRFVYTLNGDSTVEMVPVETGIGVGAWVEVNGPVRPGTKVVTRGNERLRPGQKVDGERLEYALP